MDSTLAGFVDELEKIADGGIEAQQRELERYGKRLERREGKKKLDIQSIRGHGAPRQRDYLASALIGMMAYPAMGVLRNATMRALRNRSVMRELSTARIRNRPELLKKLQTGPLFARSHLTAKPGQVTPEDLITRSLYGGVTGSLLQVIKDRLAGSIPQP